MKRRPFLISSFTFLISHFSFLICFAMPASAQWRIGATAGYGYNEYSVDRHYMVDYRYKGLWGVTAGIAGQYDIKEWLGVRAEVNWAEKGHRLYRSHTMKTVDNKTYNHYLQLPVMASFSFGGSKVRGFCNAGIYGAYWLKSHYRGFDVNAVSDRTYLVERDLDFDDDRDQRWDCGFVGGLGVEYRFARRWSGQLEGRCYYSTTSTQKRYQRIRDPRYNTYTGMLATVFYHF